MATSIKAQLRALIAKKDKIVGAVYACGKHEDRFADCRAKAPDDLRRVYNDLRSKCIELEAEAVAKGKAWRNSLGSLTFYR